MYVYDTLEFDDIGKPFRPENQLDSYIINIIMYRAPSMSMYISIVFFLYRKCKYIFKKNNNVFEL